MIAFPWWRHQIMMTSSNGNIFRVTGHLCGEFTGPRWIPTQRPVTRSFNVFFDLCLNKQLSKQSWGWWFETPWCSLWRHCNAGNAYDNHILRLVYRYYVFIGISIFRRYEILMSRSEDEYIYIYIYIYIYVCVCVFVCARSYISIDIWMWSCAIYAMNFLSC